MTDSCVDDSGIIFSESYSSPNGFSGGALYDGTASQRLLFVCLLIWLVGWVGLGFDYGNATVDKLRSVYMLDSGLPLSYITSPAQRLFIS